MGEQGLKSHLKSYKHLKNMELINCLFQPRRQPVKNTTEQLITKPPGSNPPVHQKQLKLAPISSSAEKRKAEIFWAPKCVLTDISAISVDGISDLFEAMLSDSQIVKDFQMSRTKVTYLINLAIPLYFMKILDEFLNY